MTYLLDWWVDTHSLSPGPLGRSAAIEEEEAVAVTGNSWARVRTCGEVSMVVMSQHKRRPSRDMRSMAVVTRSKADEEDWAAAGTGGDEGVGAVAETEAMAAARPTLGAKQSGQAASVGLDRGGGVKAYCLIETKIDRSRRCKVFACAQALVSHREGGSQESGSQ
jgi:hypothetical protein